MPNEQSTEEIWVKEESKPVVEKQKKETSMPEDQRRKKSELSVYKFYFASAGYLFVLGNLLCAGLWMFLTEFSSKSNFTPNYATNFLLTGEPAIWLMWWSEDNEIHPNRKIGMYMGIYAMFGVLSTFFACMAGWYAI